MPSRETCIGALQHAADRLGQPPTTTAYDALGLIPSLETIYQEFDSWEDALDAAELGEPAHADSPGRPAEYSVEDCRRAIREVATRTEKPLSWARYERYRDNEHPSGLTIRDVLGEFEVARDRTLGRREYDEADVRSAIRSAAGELGEPLRLRAYCKWHRDRDGTPSESVIHDRYDSWADACSDAGVEPYAIDGPGEWTRGQIRTALRDAERDLGDDLNSKTYTDWASGRVAPAIRVIYDRYDTWADACRDAAVGGYDADE